MKTKALLIILTVIVIASFVAVAYTSTSNSNSPANFQSGSQSFDSKAANTVNPVNSAGSDVQVAKLKMVNGYEYVLEPSTLKKGVPVRIEADMTTIFGCMRTVVMKDFGINKRLSESNNVIEFTPDKTGTFQMTCSMGMGRGVYSVTADGTASADVVKEQKTLSTQTAAASTGGTCGAGGGGCGCGMR